MLLSNKEEYSIISSKNDVTLYKSKIDNTNYRISFNINVPESLKHKVIPNKYVNIKLYETLESMNKDVIEKIDIIVNNDEIDTYLVLFRFNHLGKELGMKKKYMLSKVKFVNTDNYNCCGIVSTSAKLDSIELTDYDEIICENSNLLSFIHEGGIGVHYDFKLDLMQELPNYMKDFGALLMKKIFIKMREYILHDIQNTDL